MRQNKRATHITYLVLETIRQINSATLVIYILFRWRGKTIVKLAARVI